MSVPSVMSGPETERVLEHVPSAALRVRLDDHPTPMWFEAWNAANAHGRDSQAERDMLGRVGLPGAYVCALIGEDAVAVGRAVADTGWAGVFNMATVPQARGKGAAHNVLAALAGWAGEQAADRMYLQVESDNEAALHLYGRSGFSEVCVFHYRAGSTNCTNSGPNSHQA